MEFQKFGDWDLVINLANNMGQDVQLANRQVLAQLASRAEAMAVKFLRDQSLPWAPLSDKYLAYKQSAGLSPKTLISTSTYFQAITSQVFEHYSFAGVFRKKREKNGEFVSDIAKVMEYGSIKRGIPPRRLWGPVFKLMRDYLVRERLFAAQTIKQWKKRTGGKG